MVSTLEESLWEKYHPLLSLPSAVINKTRKSELGLELLLGLSMCRVSQESLLLGSCREMVRESREEAVPG